MNLSRHLLVILFSRRLGVLINIAPTVCFGLSCAVRYALMASIFLPPALSINTLAGNLLQALKMYWYGVIKVATMPVSTESCIANSATEREPPEPRKIRGKPSFSIRKSFLIRYPDAYTTQSIG